MASASSHATGSFDPPPAVDEAASALADLEALLCPRRKEGKTKGRHLPFSDDDFLRRRMEEMRTLLWLYVSIDPRTGKKPGWQEASRTAAHAHQRASSRARTVRSWARAFIADRHDLPYNPYGGEWTNSLLKKGDLERELLRHLQGIGKYVRALDVVDFLDTKEIKEKYGLTKAICLATAKSWMHAMSYRWTKTPRGQFVDGHERSDVVNYRQGIFLPKMARCGSRIRHWTKEGIEDITLESSALRPRESRIVLWWHDESVFYQNDRRHVRWVHSSEKAVPQPKGEGHSLMAADFMSADYGWARSTGGSDPSRAKSARILFKPGKNRDGWFNSDNVIEHCTMLMDIAEENWPEDEHKLVLDNAPSHLKRADDALSARKMPKNPSANFGVMTTVIGPNGKPLHGSDGKVLKQWRRMADGMFKDGRPQSLYFPPGHQYEGLFKGMAIILEERGYEGAHNMRYECPNFNCPPLAEKCCCRRLLYNEPDFRNVETLVEAHCRKRGFEVIFLPKFHCELNPIEACWGSAKGGYRKYPPSKSEAELEANVVTALDSVSLVRMRRFFTRAWRFMDAYRKGLDGKQAAWANKRYHSHRVLPDSILQELDRMN